MFKLKNQIKKYRYLYLALHKGEILEKVKRKSLKILKFYRTKNLNLSSEKIELILKNRFPNVEFKLEEKIKIFEKIILQKDTDWHIGNQPSKNHWQYENISNYSDVKYIWEVNRLQYLINNFIAEKDEKKIIEIIKGWDDKNPYDTGINWFSNLEVAIRGLNFLLIFSLLKNEENRKYIIELLYKHAKHLYEDIHFTEICIPNNHLIGEAAVLYCLGLSLECKGSEKWKSRGEKILEDYIHHFQKDGTYAEASLSYHRFTLQMYIMVLVFSKKYNDNFLETKILEALKKSYIFFKSIKKPDGSYPDFGDNDHGYFYQIRYYESFENFVKSLEALFEINDYIGELQLIEKIFGVKLNTNNKVNLEEKNHFSIGKYVVRKNEKNYIFMNNQKQIFHTHSDGLSIKLVLDNKNILTDSGTFSYNLDRKKRNWYRGTRSHNTVWLGENQAKEIGAFRWIKEPRNSLEFLETKEGSIIKGSIITHKNKTHKREVKINNDFSEIVVEDIIENSNIVELNWHLATDVKLKQLSNNKYLLSCVNYNLEIESDFKIGIEILKSPFSKKYGIEEERIRMRIYNLEVKKNYKIITKFIQNKEND